MLISAEYIKFKNVFLKKSLKKIAEPSASYPKQMAQVSSPKGVFESDGGFCSVCVPGLVWLLN
ncbi:hypothetical protein BpHYR1_026883 [Brachionus plicatilis]|uniref:Uncharacterized protein n=1 Tax=Brachionus plicatilis TaxID=10195 RepID=A0A3M7T920_BRAPC|nr:hypothetical protein BpHYR1_026883 [Brachionus plicatilis]